MRANRRSGLGLYFILSYLLFWVLIGATGALMTLKPPSWVVTAMQNICAWAPTFVVLLLFRRLYPGTSLRSFLRSQFSAPVPPLLFLLLLVLQAGIVFLAAGFHSLLAGGSLAKLQLAGASTIPAALLVNATSGPAGEELGWRGFAQNRLQLRFTPFASALLVGTAWAFWHTPLWFLSGFSGARLLLYAVSFVIGIFAISVVLTVFYNRWHNLLVPMWIHFLFNFLLQLLVVDVVALIASAAVGYLALAAVLTFVDRKALFRRPKIGNDEIRPLPVTTP